jgi:hypothetical protein
MNITGHIGIKSTQIFAYADNVATVSGNKNALKDNLVNIVSEARQRGLLINGNKTKYMEVTKRVVNGEHFQCGKYKFEHVKELSYLGSQPPYLGSQPPYLGSQLSYLGSHLHYLGSKLPYLGSQLPYLGSQMS